MLYDKETLEIFIEELSGVFLGDGETMDDEEVGERQDPAYQPTVHLPVTRKDVAG